MRRRTARKPVPRTGSPWMRISPAVGGTSPSIILNRVLLPAPLWPISPNTSPSADLEVDAVDRAHGAVVLDDRDAAQFNHGLLSHSSSSSLVGTGCMRGCRSTTLGLRSSGNCWLDQAQRLHRRAVQQQARRRMLPDQPVDHVVGLVAGRRRAVAVGGPSRGSCSSSCPLAAPRFVREAT